MGRSEEETLWRIITTGAMTWTAAFASRRSRSWFPSKQIIATSSIQGLHRRILTSELEIWIKLFFYLKIYLRLYLISDDLPARSAIPTNMEARRENVPYLSRMTRQDLAHFKVQINKISFANCSEKHSSFYVTFSKLTLLLYRDLLETFRIWGYSDLALHHFALATLLGCRDII